MILATIRDAASMEVALRNEYRFVSRVLEHGDFLEGIRHRHRQGPQALLAPSRYRLRPR